MYVITPIVFLLGYIYFLSSKNESLKEQIVEKDSDQKIGEEIDESHTQEIKAGDAVSNFKQLEREYLAGTGETDVQAGPPSGGSGGK